MKKWDIVELVGVAMITTALFMAGNWAAGFAWITIGVLLLRVKGLEKESGVR